MECFQRALMWVCFAGIAALLPVMAAMWMKEHDFHPLASTRERFKKGSLLGKIVILIFAVDMIVYGSTKPGGGMRDGGLGMRREGLRDEARVLRLTGGDGGGFGFTAAQLGAGCVLLGGSTNEAWSAESPTNAVVVAPWRLRGAASDWVAVPAPAGEGVEPGVVVFSDGRLCDGLCATGRVWRLLGSELGIVPEANWPLMGETNTPSRVWYATTASNTWVVTWENVLLGRMSNAVVNVQAEFMEGGDFVYRYDFSRLPEEPDWEEVVTNIVAGVAVGEYAVGSNLTTATRSLYFMALDPADGVVADRDDDGLSTYSELFEHGTEPGLADTDGDGRLDGEEVAAGTDPLARDSDGDGMPDGSDPEPLVASGWSDGDGDGIADEYEVFWFGDTNVCNVATNRDATGWTLAGKIEAGVCPTNAASERVEAVRGQVDAVKLWDGFAGEWEYTTPGTTNALGLAEENCVFRRNIPLERQYQWERYFLSSEQDGCGWSLEGMTLVWADDTGAGGAVAHSTGSLELDVATNAASVTVALYLDAPGTDETSVAARAAKPMYLLAARPVVSVTGGVEVELSGGAAAHVFTNGTRTAIGLGVDASAWPSEGEPPLAELWAAVTNALDAIGEPQPMFMLRGTPDGSAAMSRNVNLPPGVYELPDGSKLYVLDPSVCYGTHTVEGGGWGYPLDADCLVDSWYRDDTGAFAGCDCTPGVSAGIEDEEIETDVQVNGDRATGSVAVGGVVVWSGSAVHTVEVRGWSPGIEDSGCGKCAADCANGNCQGLEGPTLNSLKFRIPFGSPRKGQVSGFAYFETEGPLAIGADVFKFVIRPGSQTTVSTNGESRVVSCADERGHDLVIEPATNGATVTITEHHAGTLEHSWRIFNEDGDTSRVRLMRISRINNTMEDWTYCHTNGEWIVSDNIAGISVELSRSGSLGGGGTLVETRTVRDLEGNFLRSLATHSRLVGEGDGAKVRETYRSEVLPERTVTRSATYWTDAAFPARNGKPKLLTASDRDWSYHEWSECGFETLRVKPLNGADWWTLDEGTLATLRTLGAETNAVVACPGDFEATVFGYAPFPGDDGEAWRVRSESRWVVGNGSATLAERVWRRYEHVTVNGWAAVRETVERTGDAAAEFGDAGNSHEERTVFDSNAAGVPLVLRGTEAARVEPDGRSLQHTYTVTNGVITDTARVCIGGAAGNIYTETCVDATHGNVLREAKYLSAGDVLLDETTYCYDEKNRLRAVGYFDGTSETNAYSCCRLLWSRDREGRERRRSAVTGEDALYWAMEDVWLREVSTNGLHRVVQHFADRFGTETNTICYAALEAGEATNWCASAGRPRVDWIGLAEEPGGTNGLVGAELAGETLGLSPVMHTGAVGSKPVYGAYARRVFAADAPGADRTVTYEESESNVWWRVVTGTDQGAMHTIRDQLTGLGDACCSHRIVIDSSGATNETIAAYDAATGIKTETMVSPEGTTVWTAKYGMVVGQETAQYARQLFYDEFGRPAGDSATPKMRLMSPRLASPGGESTNGIPRVSSPQQALDHYRDGTGTPMWFPLPELNTDGVKALEFPVIQSYVSKCEPGTFSISTNDSANADLGIVPIGRVQAAILGRVHLFPTGTLTINNDGDWEFSGSIHAKTNTYTYAHSATRDKTGNFLAGIVNALVSGTEFPIEMRGEIPLSDSGNCCDDRKTEWNYVK